MKQSYLLLHIAILLAGFTGVFGKLITLKEVPLVWYRLFLSAVILWVILRFLKVKLLTSTKEIFKIGKIGILLTLHWLFFYASIKYSNISIGVICFCLVSFFTAIFEPLINKKKFSLLQLALSALTLAGISLIFHLDTSYQIGIILGVISSAVGALYTIGNEKIVHQYDSRIMNFYQMSFGTIILGVFLPIFYYFFPEEKFIPNWEDAVSLLFLALFCTVGLYTLAVEVLKKIPAFTVNISFNLEPVYSIVIAFLFFNEGKEVNSSFYLGLSLVMFSVFLQSVISIRQFTNK